LDIQLTYRAPGPEATSLLDLRITSPNFRPATLSALGVTVADRVPGSWPVTATLAGPADDLRFSVSATPKAGEFHVTGAFRPAGIDVRVVTPGARLDEVMTGLPAIELAGTADVHIAA